MVAIESSTAQLPGDATGTGWQGDAVAVSGPVHCGYEALDLPIYRVKVQRRSPPTAASSAILTFVGKIVVPALLRTYFAFVLVWYIYHLPYLPFVDNFSARLLDVSELLLSFAAVAASESILRRESNAKTLVFRLSELYYGPEQWRTKPTFWRETFIPFLLLVYALGGLTLAFACNICPWTREEVVNFTFFSTSHLSSLNMLALLLSFMAMTMYTFFCFFIQKAMRDIAQELQRSYGSITHEGLSDLHQRWDVCCQYLADLSGHFLVFVCSWYCYLFVRAVYLVALISSTVWPASRSALTHQEVTVPLYELTYLVILCVASDKIKTTLQSPLESLMEMNISRPTQEVLIHVEAQRFRFLIGKYSTMTLWKISHWTDNALKAFVFVVTVVLLLQDKGIHVKLL